MFGGSTSVIASPPSHVTLDQQRLSPCTTSVCCRHSVPVWDLPLPPSAAFGTLFYRRSISSILYHPQYMRWQRTVMPGQTSHMLSHTRGAHPLHVPCAIVIGQPLECQALLSHQRVQPVVPSLTMDGMVVEDGSSSGGRGAKSLRDGRQRCGESSHCSSVVPVLTWSWALR